FDADETFYVHLTRDPEEVATSFVQRWDSKFRASIIRAFGHGVITRSKEWSEPERADVARFYVQTVNDNIAAFLTDKPHVARCRLKNIDTDYADFLTRIGADGDTAAAMGEWSIRHNATPLATSD